MTLPEQAVLADPEESTATSAPESSGGELAGPAVVLRGLHKSFKQPNRFGRN